MTTTQAQRIADLLELAEAEGLILPLPASLIARMEESGAAVDLRTGAILPGAADVRYRLTVLGEANAVVCQKERNDGR